MRVEQGRRGLTMAEILVATTILFVVSTFIMTMFVTGLRQTRQASQHQDMENLMQLKLAELRLIEYDDLSTQVASNATFSPPPDDDRYRYSVTLTPVPGEDPSSVTQVNLTVTHPEFGVRTARTVRCDIDIDPGLVAFRKFGCDVCHSLPQAGLPVTPDLVPLGPITPTSTTDYVGRGLPSNDPTAAEWEAYIIESVSFTAATDAYTSSAEGASLVFPVMIDSFLVEGVDPTFDPNSADPAIANASMTSEELQSIATWLAQYQP